MFLLKRTGCAFSIPEIRSIFSVYKGVYLWIFYLKTVHFGLIHKGPWMLSAEAFSFQAILPSEALSCEVGRSRFFAKNTVKLKSLGMGFAESNMPHKKLELLREAMLVGRL